jgi:hypothetical protein
MPIGPVKMLASTVAPVRIVTYVHSAAARLASSCILGQIVMSGRMGKFVGHLVAIEEV